MDESVTESIIKSISDFEGTDPEELDIVLQEHIETDAIRRLVEHDEDTWALKFKVPDHTVTITGDEVVLVDGSRERTFVEEG